MVSRFEQFSSAISSIHRSIQKIERMEMAKYGLKGPHVQCLLTLKRYPEGVTASKLCQLCDKDKAAISRILAELEAAGMVSRTDPGGKRYRSQLTLTEKGLEAAAAVNRRAKMAVAQASEGYDAEQQRVFTSVLALLAGNLQTICQEGLKEEITEG